MQCFNTVHLSVIIVSAMEWPDFTKPPPGYQGGNDATARATNSTNAQDNAQGTLQHQHPTSVRLFNNHWKM